jgi:protoporphyrinogen oxidase
MIAIIGGGLTGLSIGYHLKKRPYQIFEQEKTPGGLCRSTKVEDFTFDYTGHLLHARDQKTHRLLKKILSDQLQQISRKAAVYYKGIYTPYPFQANTYGLPKEIIYDCIMGFIESCIGQNGHKHNSSNFKEWIHKTFGDGIARHFLTPYNEKLWQMSLHNLTTEWVSWSIPRPALTEVINGALGIPNPAMGYNAYFLFPKRGGIEIFPQTLCRHVQNISCCKTLASINLSKRRITFQDGYEYTYESLVSTIPLPRLLGKIEDLPAYHKGKIPKLRFVSVQNLNLGIDREKVSNLHWIYFPEPEFPFYRVGFYSNFSSGMAPRKTSSLYIEVSSRPKNKKSAEYIREDCIEGLRRCGLLGKKDRIIASAYFDIECAYVVFDTYRKKHLRSLLKFLKRNGIYSVGRYGSWNYSSMEDCLMEGQNIARILR